MFEYTVVVAKVKEAEETMNRMAQEGWQVVSTNICHESSITINGMPMIITFGRKIS